MKKLLALIVLCSAIGITTPLPAQTTTLGQPSQEEFSRLRGISAFYIDVASQDGATQDADLRNELRDLIELELRRANLSIRPLPVVGDTENLTPMLRLNLKFDRGMGRFACDMQLEVRDQVEITRNRKTIVATTFQMDRSVSSPSDIFLRRDVKARTREMVNELISGLKKANG